MEQRRKKIATLAITALMFLSNSVFIGWLVVEWNRTGWAGMVFFPSKKSNPVVLKVISGSPAEAAGIREGDEILEINGIKTFDKELWEEQAARLKVVDTVVYKIKRGKEDLTFSLRMESPFKTKGVVASLINDAFPALCFFVIGLFVYLKKPEDRRAHIFYCLSVSFC